MEPPVSWDDEVGEAPEAPVDPERILEPEVYEVPLPLLGFV